jgi:hypothetical protein
MTSVMLNDFCRLIVEAFLRTSKPAIGKLVETAAAFEAPNRKPVELFRFNGTQRVNRSFDGNHFFLRGSV